MFPAAGRKEDGIPEMGQTVYTIGHSTRTIEEFISLLKENGIELLVDIRTIPKSRYNPQFASESLEKSLTSAKINYEYMRPLGGLRHTTKDSINLSWRNDSFRGFADYMQTEEFDEAIKNLIEMSEKTRLAIMCAEAVPWRCHRLLVSDALTVRGVEVVHIMGRGKNSVHKITPFAKVEGIRVFYPPIEQSLF